MGNGTGESELPIANSDQVVRFSKQDLALVCTLKWIISSFGYVVHKTTISGRNITIPIHRLIMGAKKGQIVDHINGDKLDNRRENLRFVSARQNSANIRVARGVHGWKGVSTSPIKSKPYRAMIEIFGKSITIGCYTTPEEAAAAYDDMAIFYHEEHAGTNEKILEDRLQALKRAKIKFREKVKNGKK